LGGFSAPVNVTTPAVTAMASARRNSIMFGSLVQVSEKALALSPRQIQMSDLHDLHFMGSSDGI
jgi:hypothetical protein